MPQDAQAYEITARHSDQWAGSCGGPAHVRREKGGRASVPGFVGGVGQAGAMSPWIEIVIASVDQPDQQRWDEQCERIRRSGARFESGSRNWRLHLDLVDSRRVAFAWAELVVAARTYGTRVLVLDPETGMPAYSALGPPAEWPERSQV